MAFQLVPSSEADVDDWIDTYHKSFTARPGTLTTLFFPDGLTPVVQEWQREVYTKAIKSDRNAHMFSVKDIRGTTLAVVRWQISPVERTEEQVAADEEATARRRAAQAPIQGIDFKLINTFQGTGASMKHKLLGGRAYVYLHIIATHPDHLRKGAASVGMRWGVAKADELGLPTYMEATKDGKPLYEKFGFVVVGKLPFDSRDYGLFDADDPDINPAEHWVMMREPQKRQ